MKIVIETIPHKEQRYETVGDYWWDEDGTLQMRISDMGNDNYAFLVAIHEMAEAWLIKHQGIKEEDITDFDKKYEAERPEGDESEPGDDPTAPYHLEHGFATGIERMMCAALAIPWRDYEEAVLELE